MISGAAFLLAAIVARPVVNMYSSPTERADVVSQAIYGTPIGVIEEKPGWAKIRTPDDYTGWVPSDALHRGQRGVGRVAQVESLFANLYEEPNVTRHQPVLTLPFEARVEIVPDDKQSERWLKAALLDGRRAWVQRGDLSFEEARLSVPELIEFSRRYLGLPYLWGGTSTFGYDCSGFTQMLCRRRGIVIPRDAGPQAHWEGMVAVERAALAPGDLLYFGSSLEKISHTGMYIGNGEFINATTHEKPIVQINRIDDPHWTKLFVCVRRPK